MEGPLDFVTGDGLFERRVDPARMVLSVGRIGEDHIKRSGREIPSQPLKVPPENGDVLLEAVQHHIPPGQIRQPFLNFDPHNGAGLGAGLGEEEGKNAATGPEIDGPLIFPQANEFAEEDRIDGKPIASLLLQDSKGSI